jgi:hypothetical protein
MGFISQSLVDGGFAIIPFSLSTMHWNIAVWFIRELQL